MLAVSFLIGTGYALAMPFLSLFLVRELDSGPVEVGAFLLSTAVVSLVVGTVVGHWSDRRPARRLLLGTATLVGAVGYVLYAVLRNYWGLLAVQLTLISFSGVVLPQIYAYAREMLLGSPRAPLATSTVRMMVSVAWVGGPPLAALLIQTVGFDGLYLAGAAVYLASSLVVWTMLPEPRPIVVTTPADEGGGGRRELYFAMAAMVLLQAGTGVTSSAMPLFVTEDLHGSTSDVGLVFGVCAALEIPLMVGLGALAMRFKPRTIVLVGGAFALAYHAVGLGATSMWQIIAAQALHAVMISAVMGVGISYFQDLVPDRPGYASTMVASSFKISAMVGGPLFAVAQQLGYRSSFGMGLGMATVGLVLLMAGAKRPR
ncbi:MFS transporter [Saccharothrix violaceirubra]